jgi:hypothetical protein
VLEIMSLRLVTNRPAAGSSLTLSYPADAPADIPEGSVRIETTGPTLLNGTEMRMLAARLIRRSRPTAKRQRGD